jgi:hypothetical protein
VERIKLVISMYNRKDEWAAIISNMMRIPWDLDGATADLVTVNRSILRPLILMWRGTRT